MLPTTFNPLHNVKDTWHLEEDRTQRMGLEANGRKASINFVQTIVLKSLSNLERQYITCVRTIENVDPGTEVFVDYGSSYQTYLEALLEQRRC